MTDEPICNVDGCEKRRKSRWRCSEHFAKGSLGCSVDGCTGKHYGRGLCRFHWNRQSAGIPLDAPKFEPTVICTFDGCGKPHHAHGLCKTHDDRRQLWGDPAISKKRPVPPPRSGAANPVWKGDAAGYHAVHRRLVTVRGKARTHVCHCGAQAEQWAYDHACPNEKTQVIKSGGRKVLAAFSHDLARYVAMCVRCHQEFDRKR